MDMARAVDAGFTRRVGALALDAAIALTAFAVINLALYKLGLIVAPAGDPSHPLAGWLRPGVMAGVAAAVSVGLIASWRWLQGTPGALLMGANVVRAADGASAGSIRLVLRLAVALLLGGVGLLWSLGGRAALHDRLSGTRLVLEDDSLVALADLAAKGAPP